MLLFVRFITDIEINWRYNLYT